MIDGNYFAHRFYHGRPALYGNGGQPIGVLYAFADFLDQLQGDSEVTHWALALDHPAPSFRHKCFPAYKAHRPAMPEDLRQQLDLLPDLAKHFAIPCLCLPGVEADDSIGSLAQQASRRGWQVRMVSCDKDLDQLLSPQVSTWDPIRRRLRGPQELYAERGIRPEQVTDWLCMVGDSADNIPGIRGIGSIGASRLLAQYGSLNNILAQEESFSAKRQAALQDFRQRAAIMDTLVHIRGDLDLACDLDSLALPRQWDIHGLEQWLRSLGLPSARFTASRRSPSHTELALPQWLEQAQAPLAIRASTTGLRLQDAQGRDRPLCTSEHAQALDLLQQWHREPGRRIICEDISQLHETFEPSWHALFDDCHRCWCATLGDDTPQLASDALAMRHHHLQISHPALATRYDNDYRPLFLHLAQHQQWPVDASTTQAVNQQLQLLHTQISHELHALAGTRHWNAKRASDVRELLFTRCKIPTHYHDGHGPRVDNRALQAMRHQHEAVSLILHERQLRARLQDLRGLLDAPSPSIQTHHHLDRSTGAIHCQLAHMQAIPQADSIDTSIHELLCASDGEQIVSVQVQYGDLAALAADWQDPALSQLLAQAEPWHHLASLIMQRPAETMGPRQSAIAQTLFFGHLHGLRSDALARRCQLDLSQVATFLHRLREHFPAAAAWRQAVLDGSLTSAWPSPAHIPAVQQRLQAALDSRIAAAVTGCAARALSEPTLPRLLLMHGTHLLFAGSTQQQEPLISFVRACLAAALPGARIHCGSGRNWLDAQRHAMSAFLSTPAIRMTA